MIGRGAEALKMLHAAGYEAYFVGGCVRDMLLAESDEKYRARAERADIDVATDAEPDEVKRAFAGMKTVDTGIAHGTVTVLLPESGRHENGEAAGSRGCGSGGWGELLPVEITTYRTEKGYSDGRHPDAVRFSRSLSEDLRRRDFTINAMAMDEDGSIIDPFGGRADLEKGIIRAVGDPDERFGEDGLRIMRALRFASVLGFGIEEETAAAMMRRREMLAKISAERIFSEFGKLLCGNGAADVVRRYIDVIGVPFPELLAMRGFQQHNEYHRYDVLEHCVRAMEAVDTAAARKTEESCASGVSGADASAETFGTLLQDRLHMRMAALFHDVGKPLTYSQEDNGRGHFYGHAAKGAEVTADVMERFRAGRALTERVVTLVRYHDLIFEKDERLLKRWMRKFTPEVLFEILSIKIADNMATGNMSGSLMLKFRETEEMMRRILEQHQCFSLKDLAVDGRDIMELGAEQGPAVGRTLESLLDAVIDGRVPNEREALLRFAERMKDDSVGK